MCSIHAAPYHATHALRNAALSCSPSWNLAALFCSPSWNLVALVCNPLCAESESCSTLSFNACTTECLSFPGSGVASSGHFRPILGDPGGGSGPVLKIYVFSSFQLAARQALSRREGICPCVVLTATWRVYIRPTSMLVVTAAICLLLRQPSATATWRVYIRFQVAPMFVATAAICLFFCCWRRSPGGMTCHIINSKIHSQSAAMLSHFVWRTRVCCTCNGIGLCANRAEQTRQGHRWKWQDGRRLALGGMRPLSPRVT